MSTSKLVIDSIAHKYRSKPISYSIYLGAAIFGSALLWASAKFQVPFYPVPMTMQTLCIFLIAAAYGAKLGSATVGLYLSAGALGLPVFAGTPLKGLGLAYMLGPTGGYLIGFLIAAAVVGFGVQYLSVKKFWGSLGLCLIATGAIFLSGWLWLALLIGFNQAWVAGVVPFFASAALKAVIGALIIPQLQKLPRE